MILFSVLQSFNVLEKLSKRANDPRRRLRDILISPPNTHINLTNHNNKRNYIVNYITGFNN